MIEIIRDMINEVDWAQVFRQFVFIIMVILCAGFVVGGIFWAIAILSMWPLLLLIPAAFIVAIFATVCE